MAKAKLPTDPAILLSFVNTKLRDEYSSLTELCEAYDADEVEIKEILKRIDYLYDAESNRFR